jgi:hypothetical protein
LKKVIFLISIATILEAEISEHILKGEKRDLIFTKDEKGAKSLLNEEAYYLYGEKYISDRTLIVLFSEKPANLESFLKLFSLSLLRINSTGSYLFKIEDREDVISKSNRLNSEKYISSVSPNWKRGKSLK